MTDQNSRLSCLSEQDAARILGVHPSTLKRWRFKGAGPRFLIFNGRSIRYRAVDLEAYCDEAGQSWFNANRST